MIQKSVKSLTNKLNEFVEKLERVDFETISAGAFSKARKKLKHTAFIELNEKAIVETMYEDEEYKKYKGFRLCAVDGSKIRLPNTANVKEYFGAEAYKNQHRHVSGENAFSQMSMLYDVLNEIAIDSVMGKCNASERDLARKHYNSLQENDLILFDRGYCSYLHLAFLLKECRNFVVRCPVNSFAQANKMFNLPIDSWVTVLKVPKDSKARAIQNGLDTNITVRFVRVILDTGEVEVLVTSLLDEQLFPYNDFKDLYWFRWKEETFFDRIKNRLDLENFSGKTALSVLQDFYATIYISGLETVLTQDAQDVLDSRTPHNKYPSKVNKAISFNVIKNHVLDLLLHENDDDILLPKLTNLFLTSPTSIRKYRSRPRNTSARKQLDYYKRRRKIVY